MKFKVFFSMLLLPASLLLGQERSLNISVVSHVEYNQGCSDIWGFSDASGTEYAIIGTNNTTEILNLENPLNPVVVASIPGVSSIWRDIKSWDKHLYVTTDQGADGLLIINMAKAPDTIAWNFWKPTLTINNQTDQLRQCHNLFIDEKGICYLSGCNIGNGGVIFLDLTQDPENPVHVGEEDAAYAHDCYVKEDMLFTGDIYQGNLSIWDISDKTNPVLRGQQQTSMSFTHNVWCSDDLKYAFTTDERANGYVDAYDISDLPNIKRLDLYRPVSTENNGVIPHNTHYYNGYLATSWYTDGVKIIDGNRPENLIEVGSFDSWPGPNGGYNGCWGAYPFAPSGLLYISDIQTGLYILDVNYTRACYLEGNITDANTGLPIHNVSVEINSNQLNGASSDLFGDYKTGQEEAGTFNVEFDHPDYLPKNIDATLDNGVVTILDVQLIKLEQVSLTGKVLDEETGDPVPDAQVSIFSEARSYETTADNNGNFNIDFFTDPNAFTIVAGKWGYLHGVVSDQYFVSDTQVTIELAYGYQDDFIFDQDWSIEAFANTGNWERGKPNGTTDGPSYVNPNEDVSTDIGSACFITGNGGGDAGFDDVDDGSTRFTSPIMDLTNYAIPIISYRSWFVNRGGNGSPNDTLHVYLSNGIEEVLVESISNSSGNWNDSSLIKVDDWIMRTLNMQISFVASDQARSGHLVEAAIDEFRVYEGLSVNQQSTALDVNWNCTPNPFSSYVDISLGTELKGRHFTIDILNSSGQLEYKIMNVHSDFKQRIYPELTAGLYHVVLRDQSGLISAKRIIKQ